MNLRSPFGRRTARSVCIVTELPVRLQAKSIHINPAHIVETYIVRTCVGVQRIRVTASGEVIYDEPP
jgi:hypothetical protein